MSAKLMKHVEFYECEICGNVMVKLVDGGVTPQCCGSPMEMMKVKKGDSGKEKHTPVVAHPMEEDHFIGFAVLENGCGFDVKELKTKGYPVAQFLLNEDETAGRVYAWCNQHGLWEAERKEI